MAAHRQVQPAAATGEKNNSWGAERDVTRVTYARMAMCVRTVGLRGDYTRRAYQIRTCSLHPASSSG